VYKRQVLLGIKGPPALDWAAKNDQLDEVRLNLVLQHARIRKQITAHWSSGVEGITIAGRALPGEIKSVFQPVINAMDDKFEPPKPPPTLLAQAVKEVWDVVARLPEYRRIGERFNKLYSDELREGSMSGGMKMPFQDELAGMALQTVSEVEIAGETDWAKANPEFSAELRKKAARGWQLDPVTGIMKNPKTGERWRPSTGEDMSRLEKDARGKKYGSIPIKHGSPKIPRNDRAIANADLAVAGHQH